MEAVQSVMTISLVIVIIVILLMTVVYFVGLYLNLFKNKWHCMKCINKIFMLLQIVLVVGLGLAAALFAVLCIVFSNVCYFLLQASTDSAFANSIDNAEFKKIFNNCVLPSATGDLSAFLGDQTAVVS